MRSSNSRRTFLSAVASIAGLAAADAASAQDSRASAAPSSGRFDLSWLDQMKGKHKQLYDLGGVQLSAEPRPLRFGRNFLDTFRDELHLEFPEINTAVGISGPAFPMNASDRLWAKYKLGERSKIVDPTTKQPAVRNIFFDDGTGISVKAMQARGTVFWQCNVALGLVAEELAKTFQMPVADVRSDLVAGLNPGVRLMPSHVMALALAQERGFTYMKP
jgi:intracellular sulfur oxidation DsrE/DsrF family protein